MLHNIRLLFDKINFDLFFTNNYVKQMLFNRINYI